IGDGLEPFHLTLVDRQLQRVLIRRSAVPVLDARRGPPWLVRLHLLNGAAAHLGPSDALFNHQQLPPGMTVPEGAAALRELQPRRADGGRVHRRRRAADERRLSLCGDRGLEALAGNPERCRHREHDDQQLHSRHFVTVTVTLSYVNTEPSLAMPRRTYVPGSANVTWAVHLPSAGGSGMAYGGDHAELAYARVSIHAFI